MQVWGREHMGGLCTFLSGTVLLQTWNCSKAIRSFSKPKAKPSGGAAAQVFCVGQRVCVTQVQLWTHFTIRSATWEEHIQNGEGLGAPPGKDPMKSLGWACGGKGGRPPSHGHPPAGTWMESTDYTSLGGGGGAHSLEGRPKRTQRSLPVSNSTK